MSRGLLVLAAVLVVLFSPYLVGQKTLLSSSRDVSSILPGGAFGDSPGPAVLKAPDAGAAGWATEPFIGIEHRELETAPQWPLWNPYEAFGTPLAANMQSQPFYPLTIVLSLAPNAWTYDVWVLARLLIAGFGTFAFMRLFTGRLPSLLSGVAMMLTGYFIIHYDMPHLSVEVLLPALLFAAERSFRSLRAPEFLGVAFLTCLTLLGGMPESAILLFATFYFYCFVRALTISFGSDRRGLLNVAAACGAHVLGVAMSALLLLPFVEFVRASFNTHSQLGAPPGTASDPLDPMIATYVAPILFGPTRNNIFEHFAGYSELRGYFGIGVTFLALLCVVTAFELMRRKAVVPNRSIIACFSAIALIALAKRYGFVLVAWIGTLPGFRYVIFQKYEEVILGFAMAVLAGIGLDLLQRRLVSGTVVIGTGAGLLIALTAVFYAVEVPLETAVHVGYFLYALVLVVLVLLAITALSFILTRIPSFRGQAGIAIVAVVTLELGLNYIVPIHYIVNQPPSAHADAFAGAPFVRYLQTVASPSTARVFGRDGYLYPGWPGVFGLAGPTDVDAIYYERYLPFVRAFLVHDDIPAAEFFDRFTGTAANRFDTPLEIRFLQLGSLEYVVSPRAPIQPSHILNAPSYRVAYTGPDATVFQIAPVLPRATLYHAVVSADSEQDALRKLTAPDFDIFRQAVVETGDQSALERAGIAIGIGTPATTAQIVRYTPTAVTVETRDSQPGLLMLNDTNYPGWQATIDDHYAPIIGTDYLFRGVMLPAGSHRVQFNYAPQSFTIGLYISIVALLATLGISLLLQRRRSASVTTTSP